MPTIVGLFAESGSTGLRIELVFFFVFFGGGEKLGPPGHMEIRQSLQTSICISKQGEDRKSCTRRTQESADFSQCMDPIVML